MSATTLCSYCKVYRVEPGCVFCSYRCQELSHSKNYGESLLWREKDYCPRCLSNETPFAQEMVLNVQKDTIYCPGCRWQSKDIEGSSESCRAGATCLECNKGRLYLDLGIDPAVLRCGHCLLVFRAVSSTVKAICSNLNCSNYDESAGQLNPPQYCHNCKPPGLCIAPNCQNKRTAGSTFCSVECQQICLALAKESRKTSLLAEEVKTAKLTPQMFKEAREVYNTAFAKAVEQNLPSDILERAPLKYFQATGHPPQKDIGGALTTPVLPYHLIPTIGLQRLVERFQLGQERKGKKAWNACSDNQSVLKNKEFALDRIDHVIAHALLLRDEISSGIPHKDSNAGAIAWAGIFFICVIEEMKNASLQATESGITAAGVPGPTEQGNPDRSTPTSAPTV